jgi:hypothetical protein
MVDDCRGAVHAELAVVVEREGAAAQLSGRCLALARDVGQPADLRVQLARTATSSQFIELHPYWQRLYGRAATARNATILDRITMDGGPK